MTRRLALSSESAAFSERVSELSGVTVTLCEQCATCSGSCPMIAEMDLSPAEMMRRATLGDASVLESRTMWICASCYACAARCPRSLDVSRVAEALRHLLLRKSVEFLSIKDIPKEELERLPQIALVGAFIKLTR